MVMDVTYSPLLVILSFLVAILASYVALNLAHSVTQAKAKTQLAWLSCGAIAMGLGIWSMHFVGMLAFEMPGMEMAYDIPLMITSVVVAILGSALALFVVSRPVVHRGSLISSGVAMAAAISGMHYIGMYSMRMSARIEWNIYLVLLSILIALGASFAALTIAIQLRNRQDRWVLLALASTLMGIAIAGMHYTGMLAATFIHDETLQIHTSNLLVTSGVTVSTLSTTLLILGLALASSLGQRILALRQQRSDAVLTTSEEKFRLLVNAVKDYAIFMIDPNGLITSWNLGAQKITGYGENEIIGKHVSVLNAEEGIALEAANYELATARDFGHFEGEGVRRRKDGSTFWANIVIDPLFDNQGRLTGYSKVTRDITQLKEAEERTRTLNEELEKRVQARTLELQERELQLRSAKEEAEVANETKSAFLANMSHEIRTPLGAVLGFSELMLDDSMSSNERAGIIEIIQRNGKLLSTIINDILDLSKVEAGKLEVERISVPLRDLLNDMNVLLNLEASGKGIRLTFHAENDVPETIDTDPTRLRQILFNIVGNAIKFTTKGFVTLTVQVDSENPANLQFVVKDSGTGIEHAQAKRLFSPFTQADVTTTRRFGGTGLGLVLSKKLAQALGGDVVLEKSELGVGSTFVITIEHRKHEDLTKGPHELAPPVNHEKLEVASAGVELANVKVLVVDDSLDNLALLKRILKVAGAAVETANSGQEGIDKALAGDFNVVLMDLQMPDIDGFEATQTLLTKGYKKPIIALTAHAMKEQRKRCLEFGFSDHLTKPVDRKALVSALSAYSR